MPEQLYLFGVNHRTAPVELRERCAFSPDEARGFLEQVRAADQAIENVIVSTCNRTEVYLRFPESPTSPKLGLTELIDLFHDCRRNPRGLLQPHLYVRQNTEAVSHLFRLACGLESMILGEGQILRQIRDAYELARKVGSVGKLFNRLFPAAIRSAKRVRSDTLLGEGVFTAGMAAVRLALDHLGSLNGRRLLLIGSGKIAGLAAKAFCSRAAEELGREDGAVALPAYQVVNRTLSHARDLVAAIGGHGEARPWQDLPRLLEDADVVISSTGACEPIVGAEELGRLAQRRQGRPLVIVDLAVPRDFARPASVLPDVALFDIDDLERVVQDHVASRSNEIPRAESILSRELRTFFAQVNWVHLDPVIRHLTERFEALRASEFARLAPSLPPAQREAVERFSQSLTRKFIHFPIEKLKSLRDGVGLGAPEIAFLKRLFLEPLPPAAEPEPDAERGPPEADGG